MSHDYYWVMVSCSTKKEGGGVFSCNLSAVGEDLRGTRENYTPLCLLLQRKPIKVLFVFFLLLSLPQTSRGNYGWVLYSGNCVFLSLTLF